MNLDKKTIDEYIAQKAIENGWYKTIEDGALKKTCNNFYAKYGPDVLRNTHGEELANTIFDAETFIRKGKENNVVHIRQADYLLKHEGDKWIFDRPRTKNPRILTNDFSELEKFRDAFVSICDYINCNTPNDAFYKQVDSDFATKNEMLCGKNNGTRYKYWLAYLSLCYPSKILNFFTDLNGVLEKIGILFPKNSGNIIMNGKLVQYCIEHDIDGFKFSQYCWDNLVTKGEKKKDEKQDDQEENQDSKENDSLVSNKSAFVPTKDNSEKRDKDPNGISAVLKNSEYSRNRNVIFYGVPGCGKSYYISNMLLDEADQKKNGKDCSNVFRVTFYPEYSYTDFVGQIQPSLKEGKLVYEFVPGPFTKALQFALGHPESNAFLIIEEINRGNAAAIFGDLFQLLDRGQDGNSEYPITNLEIAKHVGSENGKILLPKNLYVFATRNTSDQNVSALDTAFKRRWEWQHIENKPADEFKEKYLPEIRKDGNLVSWNSFVDARNKKICEANSGNGSDKQLGYYFVRECDLISENEKDMDAEAKKARFFWEKVFRYLWNDAFAVDHAKGFNKDRHSLSNVLDLLTGKPVDIKDILSENIEIG